MRTEPPTGDEFDRLILRMTDNVLQNVEAHPERPTVIPIAGTVPQRRFRLRALIVVALVVLGISTAGGALALGFGTQLWSVPAPAPAPTSTASAESTVPPTPMSVPSATAPAPAPTVPTVNTPNAIFTAASWGSGITANLSGLSATTDYAVSIASQYKGESKTPDGYFSIFSTPITVTTDTRGEATVTWIPDTFPQNYTDSLESGFLMGAYVRVDPVGGPVHDSSVQGFAGPLALSSPVQIQFLPFDQITVEAQDCIEPEGLIRGGAGLPVTVTGLVPREFVTVISKQTDGPYSFGFAGYGYADDAGRAVIIAHGNTADFPVSSTAAIAPGQWQIAVGGNYRVTPTSSISGATIPIQIGNCS